MVTWHFLEEKKKWVSKIANYDNIEIQTNYQILITNSSLRNLLYFFLNLEKGLYNKAIYKLTKGLT